MWLNNRILSSFDWINFFLTMTIALIGITFIYSATTTQTIIYSTFFTKQVIGTLIGIIIYIIFSYIDFRTTCRWGYFLYFITIALLIFTIIKGNIGMGAQRWIDIKIFKFQPSELAKLFLPAFIVYYLQGEHETAQFTFKTFIPLLVILAISFLLILKQPDLGTALIILTSGLIMLRHAGLPKKFFLISALIGIITAPVFYKFLKPYQKKRIEVFLGAGDKQRERYQVEQAKIAIGSGGFCGKGFSQGTQNRLAFLPERRTDFIYSVLCEEWGFIGAFFLLALYFILIIRLLLLISTIRSFFTQLLALGLLLPILISVVVNIGMVIGLLPVVGIPLPLMSYGLSHTWITYAALGWINNVIKHRFSISTNF
ncbi:MAG: Rod shape-determining protein RodA [candidate division TM6 bacterium GW2011_GWE2_36_25]|nr:MAG: Rod shape-determining protein RodA [candidate division TM6 bacterium GW2011_GWF2_36_131]KKQ03274.1 MAG: Rod shape-determining protein RodA [candidate division TM6 bacterium GW2011_GWE2_36_25]KKQ19196.1 MAG: Rod shape-determining protein RodA [candidate division TM6 bacterium GW2011_GWA2_36_9]